MSTLKKSPALKDIQEYVQELEKERNFDQESILQKCLILGEEIGELFKSIRKSADIKLDSNSKAKEVAHELADILIVMCTIANSI